MQLLFGGGSFNSTLIQCLLVSGHEWLRSEFPRSGLTFLFFSLILDYNQGERGLRVERQIRRKPAGSDGNEVSGGAGASGTCGSYQLGLVRPRSVPS